jgi:hypothetical protein
MNFRMHQAARRGIDRPAWISVGDEFPLRDCRLVDPSDGGAKPPTVDDVDDIPERSASGRRGMATPLRLKECVGLR